MIHKNLRGFTLIEIVVTLVIFSLLTTLTFSSYPQFNLAIGLNTSARDLSSILKATQISGSSRGGAYSGDGVYFNLDNSTFFKTFSDSNSVSPNSLGVYKGDTKYVAADDALARDRAILNGVRVKDVCVKNDASANKTCSASSGSNKLSITYNRPTTKAVITNYVPDALTGEINFFDRAYIELMRSAAANPYKCIIIYKFGQIELKDGECSLY